MARPRGQLERSLDALTIGMAQGQKQRRRALADTLTGEYVQQIHVPISGIATLIPGNIDKVVQWEEPFLYAPLQRRVPFLTPHLADCGIEITTGQATLILIQPQVIGWTVTDAQWYVGATVRFIVSAPAVDDTTQAPFSAIVHLGFEGFATTAESDEFSK